MKLHYRTIGQGKPLFILHGLFGSGDNWQTLGKKFAENYKVYFVDQRNHGHSGHSEDFSYDLMADDLHELVQDLGESNINILGHSMGGKTVLNFALNYPELIDKMIVADIGYKAYPMHHEQILEGLYSLDLSIVKSRGEANKIISKYIPEYGVRQFLLKNLYWIEKGQLAWRINIPALEREMPNILAEIVFDQIDTETLFIRGGKSNYILDSDFEDIKRKLPQSEIHTMENAGHWVHAEDPKDFYAQVVDFIQ